MAQDQVDYEEDDEIEQEHLSDEEKVEDELAGKESSEDQGEEEDDNEREAIRARRRQERQDKKAHAREREETLRRELAARDSIIDELKARVSVVERSNQGSEEAQIDTAIQESANAYNHYKNQIAIAATSHDGAAMADATEKMILSQRRYEDLNKVKETYKQGKDKPQPLDPRIANNAKAWMEKNDWYDPSGQDADSRRTLEIDRELAREGWAATTPAYWDELQARVNKQLPHKMKKAYNTGNSRSVVSGSGRESAPSGNQGTYKLSAARVSAMKDSGAWDDPVERASMIKAFKDYDKKQGEAR